MFTSDVVSIFKKNGYTIQSSDSILKFTSPDKPNSLLIIVLVACIVAAPLALFFLTTPVALLILFAALFPAYNIIKKSEIPQTVTLDLRTKCLELISINGIKSKTVLFRHIQEVSIGSFEEFSDSNAFKEEVSSMTYYITIEARGKKHDLFRFKETELIEVQQVKIELESNLSPSL